MKNSTRYCNGFIPCLLLALLVGEASAADKVSDQTRRLQQQLRAVEREKSQLTQQKADVEKQLGDATAKLGETEKKAAAAARRNAELLKQRDAMKADNEALTGKLADTERRRSDLDRELSDSKRKMQEQLRASNEFKFRMEAVSAQLLQALAASRERNERMYKLGFELIERYENKSCWTSALQAEPFTGLKRAQIEKMAEADREKFDKDRLPPELPGTGVPAPTGGPSLDPGAFMFGGQPRSGK